MLAEKVTVPYSAEPQSREKKVDPASQVFLAWRTVFVERATGTIYPATVPAPASVTASAQGLGPQLPGRELGLAPELLVPHSLE